MSCVDVMGFTALNDLHRDAIILISAKVVRLFSFGFLAVMLVSYLREIELSDERIGLMFTLTLLGDMLVSLVMTSHADRWGRRNSLMVGSLLSIATGVTFAFQSSFLWLLISAIFGVISPSGNEIGPFMAIELSSLSQVTRDEDRTRLLAWYNLFGSFATAGGALFCGVAVAYFQHSLGWTPLSSHRAIFIIYTLCQVVKLAFFALVSPAIEVPSAPVRQINPVSLFLGLHKSKGIVLQLSCLFALDSFAGAFVLQSLICAWFASVYGTPEHTLGATMFLCNLVAGVSALFAARLADLIGLVATMAVTHMPSNVLLALVPLMPSELWAIVVLCLRFSISQMDVPTRNAYVQGVVTPDERSSANGVTNVVRSLGASAGPYFATLLYSNSQRRNYPFYVAGGLKLVYDLLLLYSFSAIKTDSEKKQSERGGRKVVELADMERAAGETDPLLKA